MTVPAQVEEDDDDDMPPLDYVGCNTTLPAAKTGATPTAVDDDDDDSMPPLDYVGLAPPKEPERKPVTPVVDDDDDMPPLEYVGTSAAHIYSFREGSKVRTKGLSTAELNGQTGTILPFLGATKDRLPVRLDTGKSIKIKPENLEALPAAGPELTPEPPAADGGDSDDSMPPLEVQPQPAATPKPQPQPNSRLADPDDIDDDDDDMPPLDSFGGPPPAQVASVQAAPANAVPAKMAPVPTEAAPEKTAPENPEDDDDDMPPLEYIAPQAAPVAQAAKAAPAVEAPAPVQHDGHKAAQAAPAPVPGMREGDRVVLKGLSKADLNGQRGAIMSPSALNTSPGRLPVKLDASGRGLAIRLENLERLKEEEDDDDDMPPLEYVGASTPVQQPPARNTQDPTPAPPVEDEDDDMPPLEYVGTATPAAQPAAAKPQAAHAAPEAEDDDDELPPLECFGTVASTHQQPAAAEPQEEEDDDDMPPLEYVASPPPLQGAGATTEIKEGDQVVLVGLKKADLNGMKGTVLSRAGGDRWPVRLPNGKQALFKPENLGKLPAAASDSCDSMPPLDYVGGTQERTAAAPGPAATAEPDAEPDDDDELPPLEQVGTAAGAAAQQPMSKPQDDDDDDDDMPPLEYVGCGAATGAATPAPKVAVPAPANDSDDDDMPPLEYVGTAAPPKAQLTEAAARAVENDEDDDDDMPPLEYVGTAEPACAQSTQPLAQKKPTPAQEQPCAQADDDDDDDMPPLEYVGSTPTGGFCFAEGDEVILKGLSKAELNGQRGTVMPFLKRANGRLPIQLQVSQGSSNKVSIKPENLEKVVAVTSTTSRAQLQTAAPPVESKDEDDDDMPPLEYVGKGQALAATTAGPADDGAASDDSMPPLDYVGTTPHAANNSAPAAQDGSSPTSAVGADMAAEDSGDSMPPLEYTGQAAAPAVPVTETPKFKVGDFVILRDLRTANLNGERAQIVNADPSEPRVRLELLRTGKKLMVKWDNLERAPPAGKTAAAGGRTAAVDSDEEVAAPVAAAATATRGPPVTPPAVPSSTPLSPDALLEQMRQAMQSTALPTVLDALAQVEGAENVDWGELQQRKKQLLKKLRAKRRKLQSLGGDESPPPADAVSATGPPRKAAEATLEPRADDVRVEKSQVTGLPPVPASGSDKSSQSEKDWVVLTPGASRSAGPAAAAASAAAPQPRAASRQIAAALREWCEELQLPSELASVLEAEEVTDPLELTGVSEEELTALTQGWKIGPKGRFLKAVRRMRAAEQAELGSTCGSIA